MDEDKISHFLQNGGPDWVTWKNNPPSGSHMEGVWERQKKSTRYKFERRITNHTTDRSWINCKFERYCGNLEWYWKWSSVQSNWLFTMKYHVVLPPPGDFEKPDFVQPSTLKNNSAYRRGHLVSMAKRTFGNSAK